MNRWSRTPKLFRLLAVLGLALLLVSSAVALDRVRNSPGSDEQVADLPAVVSPTPSPSPTPPPPPVQVAGALTDTDTAETIGAERLLAAGLQAAQGPWRELGDVAWPTRDERPVYVASAELSPAGDRVSADVVIAHELAEETDTVVLRLLPAAAALADGSELEVTARLDGTEVAAEVDRDGARLIVPMGETRPAGTPVTVRVSLAYRLLPPERITDDGGPAGFGLLAASPQVSTLGHWLPVLTNPGQAGPMIPWGDVGGFPTAIWSVRTVHDGLLVTGGRDEACPEAPAARRCTWSRGIALRDLGGALFPPDAAVATAEVGGVTFRAISASGTGAQAEAVLGEVLGSAASFERRFGPVAWREVDTVAVPLGTGAAGMEFPGLSLIDVDQWTRLGGEFGTAVIAHEIGHQWFHALVGNGSLTDPVVDESLAQYLTYLYYRDTFGEGAARRFSDNAFEGRYDGARNRGLRDEPPAQPLSEFDGADAYGPLIYARGPLAWVVAEDRIGVPAVEEFIRGVVERYGLETVTAEQVVEDAYVFDPRLGEVLERHWFDATPLD